MTALLPAPPHEPGAPAVSPTPDTTCWQRRYVLSAVILDAAVGVIGALLGLLRFLSGYPGLPYLLLTLLLPAAWVASLAVGRAYEPRFLFVGNDEYRRVTNAALWMTAGLVLVSYAVNFKLARGYAGITVPGTVLGTLGGRYLLRHRLHRRRRAGQCMRSVVVMGYERTVAGLCRQLHRQPHHGMRVVGALLPAERIHPGALHDVGVPVLGGFGDAVRAVALSGADTVAVLACPDLDGHALRALAWELEKTDTDLIVAPVLMDAAGPRTTIRPIDGLPMLHVEHPEFTGGRRQVKSVSDRLLAGVLLLLALPVLLVVVAAIRVDSPGPALFRQTRIGRDGRPFTLVKFRTMRRDAESRLAELLALNDGDGLLFKIRDDPRITAVGRILRRYSLDELPQLLNVLRGQMSMVGPRPPLPSEVELYPLETRRRLAVKPGMTGLWQVSGRSDLSWEDSVRLDLRYVENWSLSSDLLIMMRTVTAVLRSSGAY